MRNISNRVSTIYNRANNAIFRPKAYKWKITILILIFPSPVCFIMLIFSSHVAEFFLQYRFSMLQIFRHLFSMLPRVSKEMLYGCSRKKKGNRGFCAFNTWRDIQCKYFIFSHWIITFAIYSAVNEVRETLLANIFGLLSAQGFCGDPRTIWHRGQFDT